MQWKFECSPSTCLVECTGHITCGCILTDLCLFLTIMSKFACKMHFSNKLLKGISWKFVWMFSITLWCRIHRSHYSWLYFDRIIYLLTLIMLNIWTLHTHFKHTFALTIEKSSMLSYGQLLLLVKGGAGVVKVCHRVLWVASKEAMLLHSFACLSHHQSMSLCRNGIVI